MSCPNPIGYWVSLDKIYPLPCGKWKCPHCGKVKKGRVLDRVKTGFETIGSDYARMMTLTLGPKAENKKIGKYWARFRQYILKNYGLKLSFFWVKEFTKKGKIHMHILVDQYVHISKIRKAWKYATYQTSHIVHITGAKNEGIYNPAGYMMKYITKTCDDERFGVHERRYGFSRTPGFKPQPRDKTPNKLYPVFGSGDDAKLEAQGLQGLLRHMALKGYL